MKKVNFDNLRREGVCFVSDAIMVCRLSNCNKVDDDCARELIETGAVFTRLHLP